MVIDTDSVSYRLVLIVVSATDLLSARVDDCVVEIDDVHNPDLSSS